MEEKQTAPCTFPKDAASSYDGSFASALACAWAAIDALPRLPCERVPLSASSDVSGLVGRVVAADARAAEALPPCAAATRDGYAVAAATAPCDQTRPVRTRQRLPDGTDCVIPREWCPRDAQQRAEPGLFVAEAGSHVPKGALLLRAGEHVTAAALAVAVAAGVRELSLVRVVRVAVVPAEASAATLCAAKLVEAVLARLWPCVCVAAAAAAAAAACEKEEGLGARLVRAAAAADALVCVGGVWHGDPAISALQAQPGVAWRDVFRHTRLGPGKPTSFGVARLPGADRLVPVWLLGGSPEAAECGALAAVVPGVEALLGVPHATLGATARVVRLRMADGVRWAAKGAADDDQWTQLVPVRVDVRQGLVLQVLQQHKEEGTLVALARKNGLLVCEQGTTKCEPGDHVTVLLTD